MNAGVERDALTRERDAIAAAVRRGLASSLPRILDAAYKRAAALVTDEEALRNRVEQHVITALRACAAHRAFREAVAAFDHSAERVGGGSGSLWGVLLYCAANGGNSTCFRCTEFYKKLVAVATPQSNDLVNLMASLAPWHDIDGLRNMLADIERAGMLNDTLARNRALDVCAANGACELAEEIAAHSWGGDMDVIAYNTLMKCYAHAQRLQCCLSVFDKMRAVGLTPTEVTLGILLNGSIEVNDMNTVRRVFNELKSSNLCVNVVHHTTFIKGLCRAGYLDEAMGVLDDMRQLGQSPDIVTYTIIIKGHTARGDVKGAFRLMEQMLKSGIVPDTLLCHNLLHACSLEPMDPGMVHSILKRMLKLGMETSVGTLSTLIKAFVKTQSWSAALEIVEESEAILGVQAEVRSYTQLVQACASSLEGRWALEVYESMVNTFHRQGRFIDEGTHKRMRQYCSRCGEGQAATRIYTEAVQ